jgi:hypothetical protein
MAPRQPQQPQRPQPRQQPQQNNPRMAAAMSVVQEDVPESLRDLVSKNEFAQKAMELLQSAGGQAAMNQPTPQPPTVAQRTDQRAAEGVAGLLQRLAPGMQQRGKQVQRAQARKMLGGGLPTQAAPNMARMANGGIVGYAEGGPTPGAVPPKAADPQDIKRLADLYRQAQASMDAATDPTAKADVQQRLNDLKTQMGDQLPFVMQYLDSTKGMIEPRTEMADGGTVKKYAGPDGSEVELDEDLIAAMLAENAQVTGYTGPSAAERRAALADEDARRAQEREARRAEQRTRQELVNRGLTGQQINEILSRRLDAVEPGGIAELRQPQFDPRNPQIGPFAKEPTEYMPEGSSIMGGMGNPPTTSETVLDEIMGLQMPEIDVKGAPKSDLRQPVIDAAMARVGVDSEAARQAEEDRVRGLAEAAYAMSPEMKAAYAQRGTALDDYYAAMLDPERQRKAERRAVLSGLATPGGIARSGIAAGANLAEVRDMPIEARRAQAEEMFGLTKEQEDVAREARTKGFESGLGAGTSVYERSMAATNQAMQSLSQLATSEETAAREMAFKEYENAIKALGNQLNFYLQKEKLSADDRNTARRVIADARTTITRTNNTIADLEAQKLAVDEAGVQRIDVLISGLREQQSTAQGQIDQLLPKVGVTPGQRAPSGGSSVTPEQQAADAILGI